MDSFARPFVAITNFVNLLAIAVTIGLPVYLIHYVTSPWRRVPPGPTGWPLIGNLFTLFQLNAQKWLKFTEWRATYGDIIFLNVAGQPIIILNSHKVAADLLDRRAGNYSDRPSYIVNDRLTGGLEVGFMQYGDLWRSFRKITHEGINKSQVNNIQPIQVSEALLLTYGILVNPGLWNEHNHLAAVSTIVRVVYGLPPITSEQDPSLSLSRSYVTRIVRASRPGAHLVEYFTWMKHLPSWLATWKRDAEAWHAHYSAEFENLFNGVYERMAAGDDTPCLAAMFISDQERHKLTKRELISLSASLYAGSETTAAVMAWFMLAMVTHPEVQKKVQAELDSVVGCTRLPTFTDFDQLPYLRAVIKETLRWRAITPVSSPHRSREDDWYEGHFIPAGSVIIPNVWCMNLDPMVYGPDAHVFNPTRFLNEQGQLTPILPGTRDEGHVNFGFGRRICPGRHIANNSLFIDCALMLWAMNINTVKNADGTVKLLDINECHLDGLAVCPAPFEVAVSPRHPDTVSMLQQELQLLGLKDLGRLHLRGDLRDIARQCPYWSTKSFYKEPKICEKFMSAAESAEFSLPSEV